MHKLWFFSVGPTLPLFFFLYILTYIQGDKDRLVPYANLAFAEKMINKSCLKVIGIQGEDHFLPWSQEQLVTDELFNLDSRIESTTNEANCYSN